MDLRVSSLLLLLLLCYTAAGFAAADDNLLPAEETLLSPKEDKQLCQLCEEFASEAFYYLAENETRTEIVTTLHQACSKLRSFSSKCISLVDRYADLFFKEIDTSGPEEFCKKIHFCEDSSFIRRRRSHDDACDFCHEVVDEIVTKLKDPNTELDIVEALLKACNNAEKHAQQCKMLIIREGPVVVEHIKKVLETKDVCRAMLCFRSGARAGLSAAG